MKFDVVIGNPPYNNDMYLDFVQAGYEALKPDGVMVMITPAKWAVSGEGKSDNKSMKNKQFRQTILPSIDEIIHFPNSEDCFDIWLTGGISIFRANKGKQFTDKHVKSICKVCELLNSEETRSFERDTHLFNCLNIMDKVNDELDRVGGLHVGCIKEHSNNKYDVVMNNALSWGCLLTKGFTYVFEPITVEDTDNHTITTGCARVWGGSDSKEVCESFKSYLETKLVRFIILVYAHKQTVSELDFEKIPRPEKLDHIFTDAELYQKYGLTQDEINIIESVIKERK